MTPNFNKYLREPKSPITFQMRIANKSGIMPNNDQILEVPRVTERSTSNLSKKFM